MDKLRAMTLLVAVADTGSFSETGRRVGLSTASVSRRITELEAQLGVTLVHRSTRNLTLSEAGQTYVARARDILSAVSQADAGVTAMRDAPSGVLRVHSRTMFGLHVLTPMQKAFQQAYPDLSVELHLSERPVRLREDGFDIDFRIAPPQDSGLMRRRLLLSQRLLVAAPDYLHQAPAIADPEDIRTQTCLTYWRGADPPYWRFRQGELTRDIPVPVGFASNNGQVLLDAARAGMGLALLDDYTVARDLNSGALEQVLPAYQITNTTFEDGIFATFLKAPHVPAKIRVFLDFVAQKATDHLPQIP